MYAVGWNLAAGKAKEEMVGSERKGRGKQIGRSAGACMLWGGIWLRAKAKEGMVESERKDEEAERKECWSVYAVGWSWLRARAKGGNGSG